MFRKPAAQGGPVDWALAERVAAKLVSKDLFSQSYMRDRFDHDCQRLGAEAAAMVEADTGRVVGRPLVIRTVDRMGWVRANIASFRRLLEPIVEDLMSGSPSTVGRKVTGTQVGALLAWMSGRVLGQYDPLLFPDSPDEQDVVYMVVPNIIGLETRYAFPPEQFRLWIAVHECTHRAQFSGVPWMPDHFRGLVSELGSVSEEAVKDMSGLVSRAAQRIKSAKAASDEGLLAAFTSPEQRVPMERMQGMMAFFEGHAEVVMSRAAEERIPDVARFHRVIEQRRAQSGGIAKVLQRLLGMEAKLKQYSDGSRFVRAVESEGGPELLARVWDSPADLPGYNEIKQPSLWIARHKVDA